MTKKMPIIRFDLNIFRDVKKLCDNSTSRNFEIIRPTSPVIKKRKKGVASNASYEDGEWETQRQFHDSINAASGRGALQQDKRQAAKTPISKRDAAQDLNNNKSDLAASTAKPQKKNVKISNSMRRPARDTSPSESISSSEDLDLNRTRPDSAEPTSTSHPGFVNPKYMCYMNATLQALFASPKFCRYLSRLHLDPNKSTSEKEEVLASLAWLAKVIGQEIISEDSQKVDDVVTFIGKLLAQERLEFDPKIQHDAHEFVIKMLEELQKDIMKNEEDDRDICNDLFKLVSSYLPTNCSSCEKNVSPSTQLEQLIYYIDMLDAKKGESIQELIDKNLVAEFEKRCCENDIKCLSQINRLPEVLLIGLKRYTRERSKIRTPLEISTELVLAKYKAKKPVDEGSGSDSDDQSTVDETQSLHSDHVYRLVGIVNHIGSKTTGGHYVAYVYSRFEETWVLCDDRKTERVDLSMAFSDSVTTCYFLVYEAVDGMDVANKGAAASDTEAYEENSDDEQMEITNSDSENDGA